MTVTVCTALGQPLKKYEGCEATVDAGVLTVFKRVSVPSEFYEGQVVDKRSPLAYYAPGAWLVCSFENEEVK